jgi:hypothetical protein
MGGKPEDLQTAGLVSSVLGLGGNIAGMATGKPGLGEPASRFGGSLSNMAADQQQRELQLQKFLQQQQQQQFYRKQSEAAAKRAEEQLSIGRERLGLSKEQAALAQQAAGRQMEQYQYEKGQRPIKEEASKLELDIRKQNLAKSKKEELGAVDFAYNQLIQENPELKNNPESFGYALASKLPNLSEKELKRAVQGLKDRGKLLQPASYWDAVKKSISNVFKKSEPTTTTTTTSTTTTTMPEQTTPNRFYSPSQKRYYRQKPDGTYEAE